MECPGFYFHFDARQLILGVGLYQFTKPQLQRYRTAVIEPEKGERLLSILKQIEKKGPYILGGRHYKRVPRGYEDQPRSDLLLFNGMHVGLTEPLPEALFTEALPDHVMKVYEDLYPLHRWLVTLYEDIR
jgi:uncharacterized protein (DUF2461 family)